MSDTLTRVLYSNNAKVSLKEVKETTWAHLILQVNRGLWIDFNSYLLSA